jgi:transposase-like protein
LLADGKTVEEVAKALEVSENTFDRWRNQYGGMKARRSQGARHLRDENGRLKRVVADLTLDNQMLKEVATGNF